MSYYNSAPLQSNHQPPHYEQKHENTYQQQHSVAQPHVPNEYQVPQQNHTQPKVNQSLPYLVIPQTSSTLSRQHGIATPAYASSSPSHPQVAVLQAPRQRPHEYIDYTPQRSSSLSEPHIKRSPSVSAQSLPYDLRQVLLVLADEYIDAANALLPLDEKSIEWRRYFKLMATGMGCLEAILKNFKIFPREEAMLRLRYALLLFEETENDLEIEEVLSKGIVLCERSRLLDLKYSMTMLLARAIARSKVGAASTMLEKLAEEAKAYEHTPWEYAIRFLRVSFAFKNAAHAERLAATNNLKLISQLAEKKRDNAIYVAAAAYQAILHVRNGTSNSIEQAQEAIASARKLQLSLDPQQYPQLIAMIVCADLACSLSQNQPEQMLEKLQIMQDFVDSMNKSSSWSDDGSFGVPIDHEISSQLTASTGGMFRKDEEGRDHLILSWLGKKDFYTLGYFLSGISHFFKNHIDTKIERYYLEGLKNVRHLIADQSTWQQQLSQTIRLHLALTHCSRGEWDSALKMICQLETEPVQDNMRPDKFSGMFLYYLKGIIAQGTGDLMSAEQIYKNEIFNSALQVQTYQGSRRDLAILAALNALIIHHNQFPSARIPPADENRTPKDHDNKNNNNNNINKNSKINTSITIATLEPLCQRHPNKALVSAYQLAATVASESNTTMQLKQSLRNAIQTAREIGRPQLLALTMNLLADKFFKNIVGQQTEKCASTGRNLAFKAGDPLWVAVADGMYASVLERSGSGERAEELRAEGMEYLDKVPTGVRRALEIC